MGFGFDIGNVLGKAAEAAENARKAAEDAAKAAGGAISDAASSAGETIAGAASVAGDAIVNATGEAAQAAGKVAGAVAEGVSVVGENVASSDAGKAAKEIANTAAQGLTAAGSAFAESDAGKVAIGLAGVASSTASQVAHSVAGAAGQAASAAGGAIDAGIKTIQENSFSARLKKERISGFRDGIKQGAYLAGEKRYNFIYAYVCTLCYFLKVDGEFSEDEEAWLRDGLDYLKLDGGLPENVKEEIQVIADNDDVSFDDVKQRLDKVSIVSLDSITEQIQVAIEADGKVTEEEEHANRLFADYIAARVACVTVNNEWASKAVEQSVREYGEHLDRVNREFKEKTKLQDADAAFLIGATALQVMRVLVINALTEVEVAGQSNSKETFLHNAQEDLFNRFDSQGHSSGRLYASKEHILNARGVPYDATRYEETNFKLFKGANHRFATLGHDPILGLIFGTSNIMTNTITCVKETNAFGIGARIPVTHIVEYDVFGRNPQIDEPVGTIEMLISAGRRVVSEPDAAACALIKQLIHIGTDLYTPCGIQIPFANLVLDKAHAEKLTSYISTGDLLKVGVQTGLTVFINWLVASLHACTFADNENESDTETKMHQIRTKKILLISNAIATSSSIVQSTVTSNPKCLDIGGAAVLVYQLFTNAAFVSKLKEEYVNSELGAIYDDRAAGLL